MKKMMSIAAIALFVAGSTAFACSGCGCTAKKADAKKASCSACTSKTECSKDAKKCGDESKKACSEKKADAKK